MKSKIPVPRKSSTRISGKSNESYSTINRTVINRENTSISFQDNKIHAQSIEKFGFQRSTTPEYQSEQINTYTNYSSIRPQKIYYHRLQNKPTTQAVRSNIILDIRKPNQSIEPHEAKIGSSSPLVFGQDIKKGSRAPNQLNEQIATKKDIDSLGDIISQMNKNIIQVNKNIIQVNENIIQVNENISQMNKNFSQFTKDTVTQIGKVIGTQIGIEIGKEIGKEIAKKFTDISQKLSEISTKINSNSSSGSLNRSKNGNGNTSINLFSKDSLEKDSSSSHYNYKKRLHQP